MGNEDLIAEFRAFHDAWCAATVNGDWPWHEKHLAEDMIFTAHPWPSRFTKQQMLATEKCLENVNYHWQDVVAHRVGDIVITIGVTRHISEKFKRGTNFEALGMPGGSDTDPDPFSLGDGVNMVYVVAWRKHQGTWQIFSHHCMGTVETFAGIS